jgi:FMN phosphatase YigB (HAD superfamily)
MRITLSDLRRLDVSPEHTVHVGDSLDADLNGAAQAGLKAILLDRDDAQIQVSPRIIGLQELEQILVRTTE